MLYTAKNPPLTGVADQLLVAGQPAGQLLLHRLPGQLALSQLGFGNHDVNAAVGEVNAHAVAVAEQADRPAFLRFGRDVPNAGARRAPAETAISDQGNLVTQAHADDVAGRREHFLHSRTAARPLVADDDDVARLDLAGENAFAGVVLALEDHAGTFEDKARAAVLLERRR